MVSIIPAIELGLFLPPYSAGGEFYQRIWFYVVYITVYSSCGCHLLLLLDIL